ncbi:MAG TPA: hypothetical protein VFN67_16020 [Polyangiales bacterium]|nr:hypothetical protein [Polyangiales bacterium]
MVLVDLWTGSGQLSSQRVGGGVREDATLPRACSKVEAHVSIERNLLKRTARMLGALGCFVALCSCVSPDLEPPGASGTTLPANPGAPEGARAEDRTAKSQAPAAAGAGATSTAATPPTVTPGNNMAAAGQGANPAMGMTTATRQPTTPPATAGAGAQDVPHDPNSDNDADAGAANP